MKASEFLRTLELGIPVAVDGQMYRLIGGKVQIAVSCDGEPIYIGSYNENVMYLASLLDEADAIRLSQQRIYVRQHGLPQEFDYEVKHFEILDCELDKDYYLSFG